MKHQNDKQAKWIEHITLRPLALVCVFSLTGTISHAQINIPSDGSDGALLVTNNVVIDLSLATTGNWSDDNRRNSGNGIYDPKQWAVVFKYSSVNISPGATISFKNHSTRAPVVWLVQTDVLIDGILSVSGRIWNSDTIGQLTPTEPGPGGFRGGALSALGAGAGYGPEGGGSGVGSVAGAYGRTYGNPEILPLMGGSGAGALARPQGRGNPGSIAGTSGGGAILIAASNSLTVNGEIAAIGMGYAWED